MPYFGTTLKALLSWLCWSDFNLANQSPFRHSQQHKYNLPDVLWRYPPTPSRRHLPTGRRRSRFSIGTRRSATKSCIDASRHNVSDPHVVIAMVQHHGLREAVQTELGSVVGRTACECILSRQATYVDDVTAATILHARQRFTRAKERSRQIRLNRFLPVFHCEFRRAFHDAHARIVHQDVGTARFTVDPLKQRCDVRACSYIGNFSHHFTFRLVSEASYSALHAFLAASAYRHGRARVRQCPRDRKANGTCCSGHKGGSIRQKVFVHISILRSQGAQLVGTRASVLPANALKNNGKRMAVNWVHA